LKPLNLECLHIGDIELPPEAAPLYDLAYNLWWTWNPEAQRLFAAIDGAAWSRYQNPVQMLINVAPARWEALLDNEPFMESLEAVVGEFERYRKGSDGTWFQRAYPQANGDLFAYFSMEYGLHSCLPIYSGGLGVLSGDHCKSASDLGLPFVAVGLLYRHGYFRQSLNPEGLQQHSYPEYDFSRLPLRPAAGPTGSEVRVSIPLKDRQIQARVWIAQVGRVPLLLLDTDIAENDPADRPITDILYIRGREMRLIQEMVLGVGGVLALRTLGLKPTVWHLNEGHCAFLQLERLRQALAASEEPFEEAVAEIRRQAVFTTHTPVPAGNEQFDISLARPYLEPWSAQLRTTTDELLALGNAEGPGVGQSLNLTAVALRTTCRANGVSQLNGEIADGRWRHLFPDLGPEDRAVHAITNGIHAPTWLGLPLRRLFDRALGGRWQEALLEPAAWQAIFSIPDEELWAAHLQQKKRLGRFLRSRTREQAARHGEAPDALRQIESSFDPEALTLGFARRFATYKRAQLVFSDLERLKTCLMDARRPVQLIFAGKAHPADRPGQEVIQKIFRLAHTEGLKGKVFLIEDYDMRVGAMMVQGVDVWLNTPRRPQEASGTSGQKAAINGAPNFSVLDGWWPEAYDAGNGWAIGDEEEPLEDAAQDAADAASFYEILEQQVVPAYYQRGEDGLPQAWLQRMKRSIASVAPHFNSDRMVRDYVVDSYEPAAAGVRPQTVGKRPS
jgi:starch phosphorylase